MKNYKRYGVYNSGRNYFKNIIMNTNRITLLFFFLIVSIVTYNDCFGCSMIKITKNEMTIVGNNEDQSNPNTRIWFEPSKDGSYGVVYVGFDNLFPQGGMNEAGLVYDGFTQSYKAVVNTVGKLTLSSRELQKKIMRECATVDDVKTMISKYNIEFLSSAVLRYVDKTGRYLYVDGDSLEIGEKEYFVQTNVRPYENKKCWRFDKATHMLENSYDATIRYVTSVMDSIHQETNWGGTLYTTVYDVNNGKVYLYYFYDYTHMVSFDLKEELQKGERVLNIPDLFPGNDVGTRYFTEYNRIVTKIKQLGDPSMTDSDEKSKIIQNDIANSFIDGYPFYYKISKYAEYYLTDEINYPRAILFLKLKGEIYPYGWSDYNDLAEAYFKNHQYQLALENYIRSVELHPENIAGKKQIEMLKKLIKK